MRICPAAGQRQPVGVRLVTPGPCAAEWTRAIPFPAAALPAVSLTDAQASCLPFALGAASTAGQALPAFSGHLAVILLTILLIETGRFSDFLLCMGAADFLDRSAI